MIRESPEGYSYALSLGNAAELGPPPVLSSHLVGPVSQCQKHLQTAASGVQNGYRSCSGVLIGKAMPLGSPQPPGSVVAAQHVPIRSGIPVATGSQQHFKQAAGRGSQAPQPSSSQPHTMQVEISPTVCFSAQLFVQYEIFEWLSQQAWLPHLQGVSMGGKSLGRPPAPRSAQPAPARHHTDNSLVPAFLQSSTMDKHALSGMAHGSFPGLTRPCLQGKHCCGRGNDIHCDLIASVTLALLPRWPWTRWSCKCTRASSGQVTLAGPGHSAPAQLSSHQCMERGGGEGIARNSPAGAIAKSRQPCAWQQAAKLALPAESRAGESPQRAWGRIAAGSSRPGSCPGRQLGSPS